jgi:hypothetical protein
VLYDPERHRLSRAVTWLPTHSRTSAAQQDQLRRALEGPMRQFVRNQDALRKALEGPFAEYQRIQDEASRALSVPTLRAIEQQRAFLGAVEGPLRAVEENQRRVRALLEGPLEQIRRNQEAFARAMEGPFAAIARNQEVIRRAMEAVADAAPATPGEIDELEGLDPQQAAWLREWLAAIAEWVPTWEQVEAFLNAIALLIAVVLYAALETHTEVPEEVLLQIGILCAATAMLIKRARRGGK